jgi:class 3 adenylate cyclase
MDSASAPRTSAYDRLVDRYIDVTSWPTSKKAALVMSMAIPFQVIAWALVAVFAEALSDIIDMPVLRMHTGAFVGAVTLLFLVALPFARRGVEARWTIYLVILVYGSLCVQLIHLLGTANTTLLVLLPLTALMVGLFFDRQAGWITIVFDTSLLAAVVALEMSGALPYAPVLKERSIDAQAVPAWISLHLVVIFLISFFVFLLVQISVAAREAQRERLREANEDVRRVNERLETSTRLIRRYVPTQLAEKILAGEHREGTRPERRKLTLFFSDVVEFTPAADQMEPEDLSALLNEYLAEMAGIADSAGATVNQFVGDGIMIFFGAPDATSDRDHALRAVRMGLEMQDRMVELRKLWFARGVQTPFRIRIGINTGVASVGDFGSVGRTTYSAIGNQTNLTARIQDHCEPGRVLISHSTWALIKDEIPCEERGEIHVKGLHYAVRVYEVVDDSDRVT